MQWISALVARLPLRWRLTLVSFGLFAVLLATFGIVISQIEEDALLTSQANLLKYQASIVNTSFGGISVSLGEGVEPNKAVIQSGPAGTVALPPIMLPGNTASTILSMVHGVVGKNIGVAILASNGSVIAADSKVPVVKLTQDSVTKLQQSQEPFLLVNGSMGQREMVVLQSIMVIDKVNVNVNVQSGPAYGNGILQLSMPTEPTDSVVVNTRWILLAGILIMLGIAAALTLPLMGQALRPLVEMERVSKRITDGSLSLRLTEPVAKDEVGRLARSFNSMVARLEKAFARQKQFVADASHELRTPLTGLGGSLEMLLLEADNGDVYAAHRLMRGMYTEVERMQRLVADLLVLSRLDEGQIKLREDTIDMGVLVCEIREQAELLAHGQEIICAITTPLLAIRGNIDQLRRVLLNIVGNALKFTPEDGRIDIVVCNKDKDMVTVEVRDTGIGIPEEALPYLFDRFYRVDQSRTRTARQGGSGLGLSIAQGLVAAHGGTIAINSTLGRGTCVMIQLPTIHN